MGITASGDGPNMVLTAALRLMGTTARADWPTEDK